MGDFHEDNFWYFIIPFTRRVAGLWIGWAPGWRSNAGEARYFFKDDYIHKGKRVQFYFAPCFCFALGAKPDE